VYDINAPHVFGLRESKPRAMHAYGRSSAPIAHELVYDINAPHVFGLRESQSKAMHAYGRSSSPIAHELVYDIVSIPTVQGLVAIMNTKATYIVMVQKAQGLVGNTHHDEKHMLTNYTLDRMSGAKSDEAIELWRHAQEDGVSG